MDLQQDLSTRIAYSQVRRATGQQLSQHEISEWQAILRQRQVIQQQGNAIVTEANRLGHPRLRAEANMANLVYYVMSTTEAKLFLVGTGKLIPNPPEVMQRVMEQQIRQVIAQFKAIGDVGGEVRATLLYSQWHEVNGNAAQAASVARSVRGIAEAMGMDEEMRRIDAVIQGNSPFQISLTQIANPGDRDYRRATQTDEEARRIARFHLGFLRLPEDRLPVIERAELIIRDAILVKYEWCQHFELLEELTHEGNPHFHYATDPTWQPECTKHRRRGLILTDASLVIDSFKRCQCSACADRCPRPKPKI